MAPEAVDEVFMGCVLPAGLKQCPARQAMLAAGIPSTTGAVTINKACGSGMQATIFGIDSIAAGTNQLVVSGGLESMSSAPQILMTGRKGQRLGTPNCLITCLSTASKMPTPGPLWAPSRKKQPMRIT